jgi:tetratricopeptide (TPR) repeat protein
VRADTNVKAEWLGEILVRLGFITQADLDRATAVVVQQKKRLGTALQELGILDKDKLEEAIASHVREILLKVFTWSDGSYSFDESELLADGDITLRVSTGDLILEAVRRIQDPDIVRYALGDMDRILGASSDPLLRFQRITLGPSDGFLISRVDGTLSAREVMQLAVTGPEETERSLLGLLCTGVLEYLPLPPKGRQAPAKAAAKPATPAPPAAAPAPAPAKAAAPAKPAPAPAPAPPPAPAPAPVATPAPAADAKAVAARRQEILEAHEGITRKNHFEFLGIPKASTEAQVKEAYFRLAKRFHPDVHHDPALADLKDKLEAIFIRLGEAYEVLRNARSRSAYESDLASRAARPAAEQPAAPPTPSTPGGPAPPLDVRAMEDLLRRADRRFQEEKYWDAIQLLEPMLDRFEGKGKQKARVLLAKCYLKNPNWVRRAEEMLQQVVHDDPKNVDAYLTLGSIYKSGNLRSRALTMFRKVLELKPEHEKALEEVAALAPPEDSQASAEGSGLLKRLFGKGQE